MINKPLEFWAAVLVAVLIKLKTSTRLGLWGTITTIATALLSAYAFAEPVSQRLGFSEIIVAALIALTGEGIMRYVLIVVNNPEELKEWVRLWKS